MLEFFFFLNDYRIQNGSKKDLKKESPGFVKCLPVNMPH